jgi:hypothetical protein
MICKLSIVIPGAEHPGAIINTDSVPAVGDTLRLGDLTIRVVEVTELLPPRGDFHFVHATCRIVEGTEDKKV